MVRIQHFTGPTASSGLMERDWYQMGRSRGCFDNIRRDFVLKQKKIMKSWTFGMSCRQNIFSSLGLETHNFPFSNIWHTISSSGVVFECAWLSQTVYLKKWQHQHQEETEMWKEINFGELFLCFRVAKVGSVWSSALNRAWGSNHWIWDILSFETQNGKQRVRSGRRLPVSCAVGRSAGSGLQWTVCRKAFNGRFPSLCIWIFLEVLWKHYKALQVTLRYHQVVCPVICPWQDPPVLNWPPYPLPTQHSWIQKVTPRLTG